MSGAIEEVRKQLSAWFGAGENLGRAAEVGAKCGDVRIPREEGDTLIIEPAPPKSVLALLSTLAPLDEDFPHIPDPAPNAVEL